MTARTIATGAVLVLVLPALGGCGMGARLSAIGQPPRISPATPPQAPVVEPSLGDQSIAGRHATGDVAATSAGASLFRRGAGAFLRDQRASSVGDIVTVKIAIADSAALGNSSSRGRAGSETLGIPNLFGLQTPLRKLLPGNADPATLVDAGSTSSSSGTGNTARSEQINTTVAAIVTGVLPNGNLVVRGRQEVRVNFELRELLVDGIIRPQDIARDNSISSSQIAEARISYGGRGQITDVQQPRWGQQLFEAVAPF